MLVGQDQEKQIFRSYKTIAAQCSQLVQDQKVLEAQLAAPMPQLPALESSTEVLYRLLYNSSNQLQLSSPVSEHSCSTRPCWVAVRQSPLCHLPWVQGGELNCLSAHRGRGSWADPCLVPKAIQ